jgi:penicillin-binding protein 1B
VVANGTARHANTRLSPALHLAGKTGTSDDMRDSWFAGYAQNLLAVVWVGRDDNKPTPLSGANGALQVWTEFMASSELQAVQTDAPAGLQWVWLDKQNRRTSENCADAAYYPMYPAAIPIEEAPCETGGSHFSLFKKWW